MSQTAATYTRHMLRGGSGGFCKATDAIRQSEAFVYKDAAAQPWGVAELRAKHIAHAPPTMVVQKQMG